jgi:hypothetical protein
MSIILNNVLAPFMLPFLENSFYEKVHSTSFEFTKSILHLTQHYESTWHDYSENRTQHSMTFAWSC